MEKALSSKEIFDNVLRRRAPWLQILVNPVRVQGTGAAQQIAVAMTSGTAIDQLSRRAVTGFLRVRSRHKRYARLSRRLAATSDRPLSHAPPRNGQSPIVCRS